MSFNSDQMKAARAIIGWSQSQLSEATSLSLPTIKRMETQGVERSSFANVNAVKEALENAGIIFISPGETSQEGGAGVRLKE
ncbi:MAG: helix-turn-helix transcriptional regulator [Cohaesibacter sp.]|nr:helix-turn-helix transcriptional regulator [Cohaesibacter sp.]